MSVNHVFLVIDDSYIDRLVSGMLVRHTYEGTDVYEVNGGHQALAWLQSEGTRTTKKVIILLDIMMPQMNGFEFLEHFDKLDKAIHDKTTIVMLSSTLDDVDMQRARKHPYVKMLLSKPLSVNELRGFVK